MKVEKHGNKYRVRKTYKGKTYILSFDYKPTEKEVLVAVAESLQEVKVEKNGSFESLARVYIENRRNVVSPSTIRTYQSKLNQLSDEFKKMRIYNIDNEDVQKEVNRLAQILEPKTVKTTYGFISSVLRANRSISFLSVKLPQMIQKDVYEPTEDDIRRILDSAKGTEYSVAFQLGVWGCRRGEICALSIDDLDGNNLRIHRTMVYSETGEWIVKESPKTDESNRILPLPDFLADEIREQGYIFNGHPNALNKAIHRFQKKLDIPPFKFHALRSYFASYAHSLGICEADILALGGWKTASVMRQVYRKSMEESKKEAVNKIMVKLYQK